MPLPVRLRRRAPAAETRRNPPKAARRKPVLLPPHPGQRTLRHLLGKRPKQTVPMPMAMLWAAPAKAAARRSRRKRRRMPPNRNCAIQRRTQWVRSKRKWAIARLYTTQRISRCRPWIPVRSLPFTAWPWGMGRCPRHSPKRGSCTSQKRSAHISTSKPISLPSKAVQTCCSRRGSPL